MEYAAPLTILSNANIKLLQGVQHQALRIIFKAPLIASSAELHAKANIQTMQERILDLSKRYVDRASKYDNPLIKSLILALDSTAKGPLAVISRNQHIN